MISSSGDPKQVLLSLGLIADPGNKSISDAMVRQVEDAQARITGVRRKGFSDIERAQQESSRNEERLVKYTLNMWATETKRTADQVNRIKYASNQYAAELGAKIRADAERYSAEDIKREQKTATEKARAADQYSTAVARAHRQIEAGQMRVVRGTRSVMSGTTQLMRSFMYLGLSGEKSMEGLVRGLVKVEAAMGAVRGVMSIAMGSARIRNASRGAVIARQLSDPAWGEAAGVGAGSMFGKIAGFVEGGGMGTLAAGGAAVAGGTAAGLSMADPNLFARLTGAIDDGASKVTASLARFAQMIDNSSSDFRRVSTINTAQNQIGSVLAQGQMDIAGLPNFQMTRGQIGMQSIANALTSGQWQMNFRNALAGQSFDNRFAATDVQRSVDIARIGVMRANADKDMNDRTTALDARSKIVDGGLAQARADKAIADAKSIQTVTGPSSDFNNWRTDTHAAGGSIAYGWWKMFNGKNYANTPQDQQRMAQDYYNQKYADDIKDGKKQPATTSGSNRGMVEGGQVSAAENEISWLEKAKQIGQERLQTEEQRKRLAVEIAQQDVESLQKQRDGLAQIAMADKARLMGGKQAFVQMDPGQQLRIMQSAKQFQAGKLDTNSIGGLMQLLQLEQLGIADHKAVVDATQGRMNKIGGANATFAPGDARVATDTAKADAASKQWQVAVENKLRIEVQAGGFSQQATDQIRDAINQLMTATVDKMKNDLLRDMRNQQNNSVINRKTKDSTAS